MSLDRGVGHEGIPKIQDLDSLSRHLPAICTSIFQQLGSQQTEATYQRCLKIDLEEAGIDVLLEPEIELLYKGQVVGTRRADLFLMLPSGEKAVMELKAVNSMTIDHMKQLEYYMEHIGLEQGYLINYPRDASFEAVDDKSSFTVRLLCGLMTKIEHLLTGTGPNLRLRNSPDKRQVEILEVARRVMSQEEMEAVTDKRKQEAERKSKTFGRTAKGEWCKTCIKEQRFCRYHKDQEVKVK
jgi:GxxExxY protein